MLIDTLRVNSANNTRSKPEPENKLEEVLKILYSKLRSIIIGEARASSKKGEWSVTTKVYLMSDLDLINTLPDDLVSGLDHEMLKGIVYALVHEILKDLEFYGMISDIRLDGTLYTITVTLDWAGEI